MGVDLEEELKAAGTVTIVVIKGYSPGRVHCWDRRADLARWFSLGDSTWAPKSHVDLSKAADSTFEALNQYALSGRWPTVGSEALLVADAENLVCLLAYRRGKEWRFWSSKGSESATFFKCKSPARELIWLRFKNHCCLDGCLAPASYVKRFFKKGRVYLE